MNILALPWLELSLAAPLFGAALTALMRDARSAWRWCVVFAGTTLGCSLAASASHYAGQAVESSLAFLGVDDLNAPVLPLAALLHLLTALATARAQADRFPFAGLLAGASVRLAALACSASWPLVGLLVLDAALPLFEIRRKGRSGRLHALHAGVFAVLLAGGFALSASFPEIGSVVMLTAVLVRVGAAPAHLWVTDLFEKGGFAGALMFATPLVGMHAALRFALPIAPQWALEALGVVSLASAVYAAGMGVVERNARRFCAYLYVSHASLVLVGLGLNTPFAVTGSLVMWASAALSITGLGLVLRAVEARVGPPALTDYHGLYDQSPALAVCFLLTGLATVGFPGTSGFVAIELLVDEAVGAHAAVGLVIALAAAVNGIGVVRAYLLLFTGRRHETGVSLGITPRERLAVLTVVALILAGGLIPQAYLESRHQAAESALRDRTSRTPPMVAEGAIRP